METTARSVAKSSLRRNLRQEITRQRDRVLDCEAAVDSARVAVDRSVELLRHTVRERDRAVTHLEQLIDWAEEFEAAADTFGIEIAERHVAMLSEASI